MLYNVAASIKIALVLNLRQLTDYWQVHGHAHGGRRAHLTLVNAGVATLRITQLKRPILGLRIVQRWKSLIWRVSESIHGEQVQITVTHPRDLQNERNECVMIVITHESEVCYTSRRLVLFDFKKSKT